MIETLLGFVVEVIGGAIAAACVWLWSWVPEPIQVFLSRVLILVSLLVFWALIATMAGDLSGLSEKLYAGRLFAWSFLLPLVAFGLSLRYRKTAREIGRLLLAFIVWLVGALLIGVALGYLGYREPFGVLAISLIVSGGALILFDQLRERLEARG